MNVLEIINEASIFSRPKVYKFGHKVRVNDSAKGKEFKNFLITNFPDYTPEEDLEWIAQPKDKVKKIFSLSGRDTSSNTRYFKRSNNEVVGVVGTDGMIEKMLNHAPGQKGSTAENKGDASEPVLSAAVVAKLIKRGSNSVDPIDENDIKRVLKQVLRSSVHVYEVNDLNSKLADKIQFTMRVKDPILSFLKSPEFWEKYDPILPSVVHYANSGQLDHYANHFYKNGKVDLIHVKSDGVSEATERKTDVEAYVKEGGITRPLKNLNISLKAGSSSIGQVGAGGLKDPFKEKRIDPETGKLVGQQGVWSAASELFNPFDAFISRPTGPVTSKVLFWTSAYQEAAAQMKVYFKGADVRSETGFIAKIANFIVHHGTKGDADIKLISLGSKGVSTIHSFKNLEQKLRVKHINLDCEYREGKSKVKGDPRPEINIFDTTSGKNLLTIRYSSTEDEKKIWNTIEMEPLLKELTTLNYEKSKTTNQVQVQAKPARAIEPATTKTNPDNNWVNDLSKDQLDKLAGKRYPKHHTLHHPADDVDMSDSDVI